jgi:excisionase family DNA binding protein
MSSVSVLSRQSGIDDDSKPDSGHLTTTEVAKLCGVSRFTIINWAKQGKFKATRTMGGHYRILASETLSLLRTLHKKEDYIKPGLSSQWRQESDGTDGEKEPGNRSTSDDDHNRAKTKKRNFLYIFGYGVGRGVHALKERSKIR